MGGTLSTQRPESSGGAEGQAESPQPSPVPTTVLTAMASQGDIEIEVRDSEKYAIGKYIVIQESLLYMVEGKGSLILDRPLCRDFLARTPVRPSVEEDQEGVEDGKIYLRNPQPSHSNNGEHGNCIPSQRQNGNGGTSSNPHGTGLDGNPHLGNEEAVKSILLMISFPVGNPNLLDGNSSQGIDSPNMALEKSLSTK